MPVLEGIVRARPERCSRWIPTSRPSPEPLSPQARKSSTTSAHFNGTRRWLAPARNWNAAWCSCTRADSRSSGELFPPKANITSVVEHDLANRLQVAVERGVHRSRIVLDPGFGFGKNFEENYPLLAHLDQLLRLGFPLLAGTSRKSFVGRTVSKRTGRETPPADRLYGSIAAMVASILRGAHIVRVHDVKAAVEAAAVADEILAADKAN